jgi:hypothetical protein
MRDTDRLLQPDALVQREALYTNLATLERLQRFAEGQGPAPQDLPGLTNLARDFLGSDRGRGAAATWLTVFASTLTLLRQFRNRDVHYPKPPDRADLEQALQASRTALEAATKRINFLAEQEAGQRQQQRVVG